MYFSRITFSPWANHEQLVETLCQDSYREHQVLWQLFDSNPDARRDFLYRRVTENGQTKYYVLSERVPIDNSGTWVIDPPKSYNPKLSEGQRLFFTLRANPVVTVKTPAGKQQRHDVVMHEKKRLGFDKLPANEKPQLQSLIQSSCIQWLQKRSEANGFDLIKDQVSVEGYQQHESYAKNQKRPVSYSSVDYQGILAVSDPDKFRNTLFHGIGKSKAFGCGLLLVKRA